MNGLIDFECGMVVGVLIILETADLLGLLFIFYTQPYLGLTKNALKKRKYTLLMSEVRGERSDCFKLTQKHRKKKTFDKNKVCRQASLNTQRTQA